MRQRPRIGEAIEKLGLLVIVASLLALGVQWVIALGRGRWPDWLIYDVLPYRPTFEFPRLQSAIDWVLQVPLPIASFVLGVILAVLGAIIDLLERHPRRY